ncbi:hypothetical protein KAFR_0B06650 [Kazachstania africana CBS 2517]|uniref:Sec1-like protein n=1 Tax=Kazachstania africana (strain ATCC 22294 / BCRC 22015 / CBS 2517 / CECT 1963 / NBRC 1671 / NRRL Y-8276) TaxID=1071382 RepID=H2ARG2_KAZAF|nr:hypothetical protein KAFR_0B06650 [Kazachstania africana CBS 2517]CCF56962.1 hypothetical protein KAFR_0B06650 [Kazachstania africana CBS 2517]
MNLYEVGDYYIDRIINSQSRTTSNNDASPKIKVLLLDKYTKSIISMISTQSKLLQNEIYLVDTVENVQRDTMRHLKCLVFIKPTEESIEFLCKELENPKYYEYHIFFNNIINKSQLERIAEYDSFETVVKVEEIFQDYQTINQYLFSFEIPNRNLFINEAIWSETELSQCTNSLLSVLLSLKKTPLIRYDSNSKKSLTLVKSLDSQIKANHKALFDFPPSDIDPLLLILDRDYDPYTPLLQPWTYQSMIMEYIGIKANIVDLSSFDSNLNKVTLSSKQDTFFNETMYLNFGELSDRIKDYVNSYKSKTESTSAINTIDDIKKYIEHLPEFKKLSNNVTKHISIVTELDKQLNEKKIWDISELEQNLMMHPDNNEDYQAFVKLINDVTIERFYKLKLACIYLLRHDEVHGANNKVEKINEVFEILKNFLPIEDINYLHKIRSFYDKRSTRVESSTSSNKDDLLSELAKKFNTRMDAYKKTNVSNNVYMQHIPKLSNILTDLSNNKLSTEEFPFLNKQATAQIQDVIIFIIGGITLEELRLVNDFNSTMKDDKIRIVIGGTSILTTENFLNSLR